MKRNRKNVRDNISVTNNVKEIRNTCISLVFAVVFLIGAGVVFYFMYPTILKAIELSSKKDQDIDIDTKIEQTSVNTKLLYYGTGLLLCLIFSVFSLMCYYDFKMDSTCHYD